jgi:oligopeptide transport system substrate-binding protein
MPVKSSSTALVRGLFALGCLLLMAFAGAGSTTAAASKTLRIAITAAAPDPFDPPLVFTSASIDLTENVFDGLVALGAGGKVVPAVANSWKVTAGGTVYTFQLRKNARFQNGTPITAQDFVYSLHRALDPTLASPISFYLANIKGAPEFQAGKADSVAITAPQLRTLRIELLKPAGDFLRVLSRPVGWVVDRRAIEKFGKQWVNPPNLNGTGPYKLSARTGNTKFVLTVNSRYWQKKPALTRVEVTVVPDSTAAVARYQSGEFDVVNGLSSASVIQARSSKSLRSQLKSAPLGRTDWLGLRVSKPPFNKKNVRLAFQHAINKAQLVRIAMGGQATVAKDWIPQGIGGNINKTWAGYKYDPARARKLLSAAGYPGGKDFPTVEIYYSTEMAGIVEQAMELIQAQLKTNLGVNVGLRNMPRQALTTTLRNPNTRPLMWAWTFGADIPDASTITSFFGVTGSPFNFEEWSNKSYDTVLAKALATSADAKNGKRDKLFAQSELIRMKDAPLIPLYYPNQTWLAKPAVKNFGIANNSLRRFSRMSLR